MPFLERLSEFCPPTPTLTERDLPDLTGKVYLITGGTSGVGHELARMLYSANATVYITGRSATSGARVIADILAHPSPALPPPTRGAVHHIAVDFADLGSIAPALRRGFLEKETRLHSVWYNAGVMNPPAGAATTQGYELQWGTNVVAHFLVHTLLLPTLLRTAADPGMPPNSVRTVWVASDGQEFFSPKPHGIDWATLGPHSPAVGKSYGQMKLYGQSKAAAVILACETGRRYGGSGGRGLVGVSLNPGHLKTPLASHQNPVLNAMVGVLLFEPRYGALTELYAGFAGDEVLNTEDGNGRYLLPWGRVGNARADIVDGWRKGGTGERLWSVLEEEVKAYR